MKLKLARIGRFWQYVGVAIAAHAATRHAMVWGQGRDMDPAIVSSWMHLFIGVSVAIILFWTGVYLEGRGTRIEAPKR
ncbi:MAG: hypothetical protein L0Y58_12795 [Verrucomicrobia subdivision 3 bacterium]|nr:hypothetical protein [Limisphaerales bacterium]